MTDYKAARVARETEKTTLRKTVLPIDEIRNLQGKGIKVSQRKGGKITYGDVEGLRGDLEIAIPKTTITSSYIVEKIPVPSVNNVKSLSSNSIAFNKPKLVTNFFQLHMMRFNHS